MEGPHHGYDLHRRVSSELGEIWYMGMSNIYSSLKRLAEEALIEPTLEPQESRPARTVYHITPEGRDSFLDWVRSPVFSMRRLRVELLAKLYFFRSLNITGAGDLISEQESICAERLGRLEARIADSATSEFTRLVYDFRRRQIAAILEWLQCLKNAWAR
jgi:PadR family transcriptional regulator AphA